MIKQENIPADLGEIPPQMVEHLAVSHVRLAPRQIQVGNLIACGFTFIEIARILKVDRTSVRDHYHNLIERLGGKTRLEIAALFTRKRPEPERFSDLKAGERLVTHLICSNETHPKIAKIMGLALTTVREYAQSALQKTGTHRGYELVAFYVAAFPDLAAQEAFVSYGYPFEAAPERFRKLNALERLLIDLTAQGIPDQKISALYSMPLNEISAHTQKIIHKTDCSDRHAAVTLYNLTFANRPACDDFVVNGVAARMAGAPVRPSTPSTTVTAASQQPA